MFLCSHNQLEDFLRIWKKNRYKIVKSLILDKLDIYRFPQNFKIKIVCNISSRSVFVRP